MSTPSDDLRVSIAQNRFGLGARRADPKPADSRAWLLGQLDTYQPSPPAMQDLAASTAIFAEYREDREDLRDMSDTGQMEARKALRRRGSKLYRDEIGRRAAIALGTAVDVPFGERLVWFWANHFTVSLRRGSVVGLAHAYVREAIRPHVTGRFVDMLGAVMRHPAMLYYLDNAQSAGPDSPLAPARAARGGGAGGAEREPAARDAWSCTRCRRPPAIPRGMWRQIALVLTGWSVARRDDRPGMRSGRCCTSRARARSSARRFPRGRRGWRRRCAFLARHPATHRNLAPSWCGISWPMSRRRRRWRRWRRCWRPVATCRRRRWRWWRLPEAWEPLASNSAPVGIRAGGGAGSGPRAGRNRRPRLQIGHGGSGPGDADAPLPNGWPRYRRQDWAGPGGADAAGRLGPCGGRARRPGWSRWRCRERPLGPLLGEATRGEMMRAGSRREALALLFASPEFQRR